MKEPAYKSYDDLPLFLNAEIVAQALGISPTSSYELMRVVANSVSLASPQAARLLTMLLLLSPHKRYALARGPHLSSQRSALAAG